MRRHPSRDSPSCTREFGPIDATRRDRLLAPARTGTQSRDIELTHCVDRFAFAFGVVVAVATRPADSRTGLAATLEGAGCMAVRGAAIGAICGGAGVGATVVAVGATVVATSTLAVGAILSRAMLSVVAIGAGEPFVSLIATVASAVSAGSGNGGVCAAVFARCLAMSGGLSSRKRYPTPTDATTAAMPTPLQICGPIGGRSGFVWHHRHSPTLSG